MKIKLKLLDFDYHKSMVDSLIISLGVIASLTPSNNYTHDAQDYVFDFGDRLQIETLVYFISRYGWNKMEIL